MIFFFQLSCYLLMGCKKTQNQLGSVNVRSTSEILWENGSSPFMYDKALISLCFLRKIKYNFVKSKKYRDLSVTSLIPSSRFNLLGTEWDGLLEKGCFIWEYKIWVHIGIFEGSRERRDYFMSLQWVWNDVMMTR